MTELFIFDIDGTLVDSVGTDDACFIAAFSGLYDVHPGQTDWNAYPHVTDAGLFDAIFREAMGRPPDDAEERAFKAHFRDLIAASRKDFRPVEGAADLLDRLRASSHAALAFATGGWKATALLKLAAIGYDPGALPFATSDDHFDRAEITAHAIRLAGEVYGRGDFRKMTYVGDGLWDLRTAEKLGLEFIGVDCRGDGRLKAAGAKRVLPDLRDQSVFIG